jgi:Holliday junction resolvasome RuvABC endonuclease subunit
MMSLSCIRILAIDLSYRDTGVCIYDKYDDGTSNVVQTKSIKSKPIGSSFSSYYLARLEMKNTITTINSIFAAWKCDCCIIEMPCFTQSSKSAIAIGLCWGATCYLGVENLVFIEPSALKKWSSSKKGDKKTKVKQEVESRGFLDSNDNIVDAVGIAMMFSDLVSTIKYNETNRR